MFTTPPVKVLSSARHHPNQGTELSLFCRRMHRSLGQRGWYVPLMCSCRMHCVHAGCCEGQQGAAQPAGGVPCPRGHFESHSPDGGVHVVAAAALWRPSFPSSQQHCSEPAAQHHPAPFWPTASGAGRSAKNGRQQQSGLAFPLASSGARPPQQCARHPGTCGRRSSRGAPEVWDLSENTKRPTPSGAWRSPCWSELRGQQLRRRRAAPRRCAGPCAAARRPPPLAPVLEALSRPLLRAAPLLAGLSRWMPPWSGARCWSPGRSCGSSTGR